MQDDRALTLELDGAVRVRAALRVKEVEALLTALAHLPTGRAGIRLHHAPGLRPLLSATGSIGRIAAARLGERAKPVRAILFDKTEETNWALGWHQDRVVAVRERIEHPGYGPWTIKDGIPHVAPPYDLLAGMLTLRVHLDPVTTTNAPLLIAPGSHRLGRIAEADIEPVADRFGTVRCLADAGDVWIYSTPILHASDAAARPHRRRVLQLDFAACDLPGGLRWHGIGEVSH